MCVNTALYIKNNKVKICHRS